MERKNTSVLTIALFIFFFLLGCGFTLTVSSQLQNAEEHEHIQTKTYPLINPIVGSYRIETPKDMEFSTLEKNLNEKVKTLLDKKDAAQISIYFRDLNNGTWIGIDEQEKFSPASLLKIPLAMTILREVQKDPSILSKTIPYTEEQAQKAMGVSQQILPSQALKPGNTYTVDELITAMIRYSDNGALQNLLEHTSQEAYQKTYTDMGLNLPMLQDYLTVKNYSSILRILYNSSYLSPEMSSKLLELMTQSQFDGLTHGLPETIPVAHKFGERELEESTARQLHDCGIIYYPNHPYVLCIMTKGQDMQKMTDVIQVISLDVFKEVQTRFPQ